MKRLFLLFTIFAALLGAASAPNPANGAGQTLERNLSYCRVHTLPDDLPAGPVAATGTLVLDLRFVRADPDAAAAFARWLKARSRPQSPVLVLVNSDTAPALLTSLPEPGVVSIGPAITGAGPDVALTLDSAMDRVAYEAFEHGASIDELINPKIDKIRHDEAAMAKERAAGTNSEAEDDSPLAASEKTPGAPAAPVPAPPVDHVLQRAVQLYHALLALGKIR
jgi:hypothetical protein